MNLVQSVQIDNSKIRNFCRILLAYVIFAMPFLCQSDSKEIEFDQFGRYAFSPQYFFGGDEEEKAKVTEGLQKELNDGYNIESVKIFAGKVLAGELKENGIGNPFEFHEVSIAELIEKIDSGATLDELSDLIGIPVVASGRHVFARWRIMVKSEEGVWLPVLVFGGFQKNLLDDTLNRMKYCLLCVGEKEEN